MSGTNDGGNSGKRARKRCVNSVPEEGRGITADFY